MNKWSMKLTRNVSENQFPSYNGAQLEYHFYKSMQTKMSRLFNGRQCELSAKEKSKVYGYCDLYLSVIMELPNNAF